MSETEVTQPAYRVSLNYFAIPLGLAGLGGAWTAAATVLDAPEWANDALFFVSGMCWLAFTAVYVGERVRDRGAFRADREHPIDGAAAAFLPVVGILLTTHFERYVSFDVTRTVCWLFVVALSVVAGQLFAYWLTGQTSFNQLHPGYFLPLVAGPFVASIGLSTVHAHTAARAALGVGMFFWVIIGGVITARLITAGPLPPSATPALSVLLAPPATGGIATFAAYPGPVGTIQTTFLGIFLMMLMVQIFLLPRYLRLAFGLGFWNFTFPISASANYVVRWCRATAFAGWQTLAWTALGIASTIVLAITAATFRSLVPSKNYPRN